MVAALVGPFMRDSGLSTELIAVMKGTVGSVASLVGAAVGSGGLGVFWAGSIAEHLFGSMATVALFTLMMDASDPEYAGTDYTLLACAIVVAMGLANFTGASIADAVGYAPTFVTGFLLSGIGCLLLVHSLDARRGPARLHSVWRPA